MEQMQKKPLGFGVQPAHGNVSLHSPNGLILSTGNLYFTANDASGAYVYRMAQVSGPGEEILLYREPLGSLFGDIAYAGIGDAYYGYFFASSGGNVTIKRISLAGSQEAEVLTPPFNDLDILNTHHNLVCDGQNLYWQQATAVKKMSVNGGEIVTLDPSDPNTPTAGVYLHEKDIIYASVSHVRYVPKLGAITIPQLRTIVTANARVLSIAIVLGDVYWGDNNGALQFRHGTDTNTVQANSEWLVTAIASYPETSDTGVTLAWLECNGANCQLRVDAGVNNLTVPTGINPLGLAFNASGLLFWGDALGVHRLQV